MKRLAMLTLSATLLLATLVPVSAANATNISIDGKAVVYTEDTGTPYIDSEKRTQVPLSATMNACGAEVIWDATNHQAIVRKDGTEVKVPIGQKYILVNGDKRETDTAASVKNGRTFLPIAHVLRAFGAEVQWDGTSKTVRVYTTPGGAIMTVRFIDVGQADAILIDYGKFEILVDGGNKADGADVVAYLQRYVNGPLEVILATHEHEDHIGGLPAVLSEFEVEKVIDNGRVANTNIYEEYSAAVEAEACEHLTATDMSIDMGGAQFKIIKMDGNYSDPNNNSVISMIDYGTKVLLMGDAEQKVEQTNLSKFVDIDILKAGHHGSATSSGTDFLNRVKPETVIVSAETGNVYQHPHLATMQRFAQVGAKTYGTLKSGTVVATLDGRSYELNTNHCITAEDAGDRLVTGAGAALAPSSNNGVQTELCYIGNKNSKIYHRPDCASVKRMKEQNKVILNIKVVAVSEGYVPCKICNP